MDKVYTPIVHLYTIWCDYTVHNKLSRWKREVIRNARAGRAKVFVHCLSAMLARDQGVHNLHAKIRDKQSCKTCVTFFSFFILTPSLKTIA